MSRGTWDMAGQAPRGSPGPGRSSRRGSSAPLLTSAATVPGPTGSTYRSLLARGLAPDEAASLTAFLSGIPITDKRWTIQQVNRLLFFRELNRRGRFGTSDGDDTDPH
jgi:hypothetical protein